MQQNKTKLNVLLAANNTAHNIKYRKKWSKKLILVIYRSQYYRSFTNLEFIIIVKKYEKKITKLAIYFSKGILNISQGILKSEK